MFSSTCNLLWGKKKKKITLDLSNELWRATKQVFGCLYSRLMAIDVEKTVNKTIGNVWMFETVMYALRRISVRLKYFRKRKKKIWCSCCGHQLLLLCLQKQTWAFYRPVRPTDCTGIAGLCQRLIPRWLLKQIWHEVNCCLSHPCYFSYTCMRHLSP